MLNENITKKRYLKLVKSSEDKVAKWGLEHLTKVFPESEETINALKYLIENRIKWGELKNIIRDYLKDNFEKFDPEYIHNIYSKKDFNFEEVSILYLVLAKHKHKVEEIINHIRERLFNQSVKSGLEYENYLLILTQVQTESTYKILERIKGDNPFGGFNLEDELALLKHKKLQDIREVFGLEKLRSTPKILSNLADLFIGSEFFNEYIYSNNTMSSYLGSLEYNFRNNAVQKTIKRLKIPKESENVADGIISKGTEFLEDQIIKRYDFLGDVVEIDEDSVLENRDKFLEQDFWIAFMNTVIIENLEHRVVYNNYYLACFVVSMMIVFEENLDFKKEIELAKNDDEYLWKVFMQDRIEIPQEIVNLVSDKFEIFEDRILQEIRPGSNLNSIFRLLDVVKNNNCSAAVPNMIDLLAEDQPYSICENVMWAIPRIDFKLKDIKNKLENLDFSQKIYLSEAISWKNEKEALDIIIDFFEISDLDYEPFLMAVKNIGSLEALEYLEKNVSLTTPLYFDVLLIMSLLNDDKERITKYRKLYKKAMDKQDKRLSRLPKLGTKRYQEPENNVNKTDEIYDRDENGSLVNKFKGVGRNDPCPCGSGKKYKKCCI